MIGALASSQMSGVTVDSQKPSGRLPHVVPPQSGDIHCSLWILRQVDLGFCVFGSDLLTLQRDGGGSRR